MTVIAGVPGSPIVKSLTADLEKRGFIVYVIVTSDEEQAIVQAESRLDVKPLYLDLGNVCTITFTLQTNLSSLSKPILRLLNFPSNFSTQ
jgi:Fungal family of unknown function (DUF1776)